MRCAGDRRAAAVRACRRRRTSRRTGAWADDGIVQTALRELKKNRALDSLVMIADVCLCEYTSHGHCGVVARDGDHYEIENDSSVALIGEDCCVAGEGGRGYRRSVAT